MTPLNIIFAGSGEFGLPTLQGLQQAGHRIIQTFTQPDRPAGRGRKLTPTPIGQYAIEQNLPLVRTADINGEPLSPADIMIVIAFGQKISEGVSRHARLGSVNLHASRLPKYRGAAPINWAILNGDAQTGNSIIRLAQRMDAGAILAMSALPIGQLETAGELHDHLADDGTGLMLNVLEQLATGAAAETPQDESKATKAPKLNREASQINWNMPAHAISSQIRGMYPWPACRIRLLAKTGQEIHRLTLVRARPIDDTGQIPGEITTMGTIAAGTSAVEIVEVQPEGKRPMPLGAYQNGHAWDVGMRVESIV